MLGNARLAGLFRERFAEQGGKVYETRTFGEAVLTLTNLLVGQGVRRAVVARMKGDAREHVLRSVRSAGIEVIEPSNNAPHEINMADAGITMPDLAVAETGTLVEITQDQKDRLVSTIPRIHACLLNRENIVRRLQDLTGVMSEEIKNRGAVITLISGPSKTADIELRLVVGVHGPHQVHVILYG